MDAPSTGWVTVLAGLLARGSLLRCVRPSQLPSGLRRELAAHSYGGSHGLLQREQFPRSLFRPRVLPGEPARWNGPPAGNPSQAARRNWAGLAPVDPVQNLFPAADYSRFTICFFPAWWRFGVSFPPVPPLL